MAKGRVTEYRRLMRMAGDAYYNGARYFRRMKKEIMNSRLTRSQKMKCHRELRRATYDEYL